MNYFNKLIDKTNRINNIGVYLDDIQIGSYTRNYDSFIKDTFYPFERNGKWYALYSSDYTCTRLMSLPDCVDIGGENPDAYGFCPVEYFVPMITTRITKTTDPQPYNPRHDSDKWTTKEIKTTGANKYCVYHWPEKGSDNYEQFETECNNHDLLFKEWLERNPFITHHASFGFVAGCVWGDDSSWKIQYLDLSRILDGVLIRDDRFGYIELSNKLMLKDVINVDNIVNESESLDKQIIDIMIPQRFSLTGSRLES